MKVNHRKDEMGVYGCEYAVSMVELLPIEHDDHKHYIGYVRSTLRWQGNRIATLESQLADAKRNEERAVAEVGELKASRDIHYKSMSYYYAELVAVAEALGREHDGNEVPIGGLAQATRVLLSRVVELGREPKDALTKLHTLEAAVRAVRDARDLGLAKNMLDSLSKRKALYALVSEVPNA